MKFQIGLLVPTDDLAPQILNVLVDGVSSLIVAPGTVITLTATIDDGPMGNSNVGGANYTIGEANWPGTAMNPVDGAFDSPNEQVSITIDTTGWSNGNHLLYVYGWDDFSNYNTIMAPYAAVVIDASPPTSSVDNIIPYWYNTVPMTITATAQDTLSRVQNVELYYSFSSDEISWGGWILTQTDNTEPWLWYFYLPQGAGYYRFRTIAEDAVGNQEGISGFDAECGYDEVSPSSTANPLIQYWLTTQHLTITAVATDDLSGIYSNELFYRHSNNNLTWTSWTLFGSVLGQPWSWEFDLPDGEGYYEFYTRATDNALNIESGSAVEIRCAYDNTPPVADAGASVQITEATAVTFDGSGSWDNIQIRSYEWTFMEGTSQILFGVNPTHTFQTSGIYEVTLRVTDLASHWAIDTVWVNVSAVDDPSKGVISGRVRDVNGDPVEGALVTVADTPYFARTDTAGHYIIDNIPPGTYEVYVAKDGFQTRILSEVDVNAGQETSNQDITLPMASEETKPSPFDFWWVIVLAVVILVVFLVILMILERKPDNLKENMPGQHDIYPTSEQPMQREYPPSLAPPSVPGYLESPPPPDDYVGHLKASEPEE
jgi:hypothetical protein